MASDDDRQHLLDSDDGEGSTTARRRHKGASVRGVNDVVVDGNRLLGDDLIPDGHNRLQTIGDDDYVVAVFVVAFDTKAGNVVEWKVPEDIDLDGIEFKAMASGSHTLKTDFVYFRKDNMYGLACFENMPVESQQERGARMKSVGILATSYTLLYRHMQFLEAQVRYQLEHCVDVVDDLDAVVNNCTRHQLQLPGRYEQLRAFWEDKKGTLPQSGTGRSLHSSPSSDILPADLKVTHPSQCFTHFMQFFGHQMLILWKLALLGKRILFFSPPPIGDVCYRVYCCCCLANHAMHRRLMSSEPRPHFYINVADIDSLESEVSYIACTTERIFETKPHLYDVYVDNQNVTTQSATLKDLLKVSSADRDKFDRLNNIRNQGQFSRGLGDDVLNEEDMFTSFFTDLNNRIFQTLIEVSQSQDRQLTSEHMKVMGLDPVGDRIFLMELVEIYGIDVMLIVDNPCCPT